MTPPDIVERLKVFHAKTDRVFPSLGETIDEFERLRAEIERLKAALRNALAMVEDFASGSGMSYSGRAEFDRLAALVEEPRP